MYGIVEQIKNRLDIQTALQRFTTADLSKLRGTRGHICCPFHHDNHPSFHVDTEKNKWRCYGSCGTGGDVISLYATARGIANTEAIHELAGLLGIAGQPPTPEEREQLQRARTERENVGKAKAILDETYNDLCEIFRAMQEIESLVESMVDVEQIADIYHAQPCIEHLLECLSGEYGDNELLSAYIEAEEVIAKWRSILK